MYKFIILLFALISAACEATLMENMSPPCGSKDNDCFREKFNGILQYLAENGSPECGIPDPLEPYNLEKDNYEVSVLGGVDIKVYKGFMEGLKTCEFTYSAINFALRVGIVKLKCEQINIQGDYKLTGLLQGQGQVDLGVGDLNLDFLKKVKILKGDDGEYYFQTKENANFDIGELKFHATDINAGPVNITDVGNEIIQKNWKWLLPVFGRDFVAEGVRIFEDNLNKIQACIPAKYFLKLDDLKKVTRN